jgi:peroxiredoxin
MEKAWHHHGSNPHFLLLQLLQPLHNVMVRTDANVYLSEFYLTGPYLLISYPLRKFEVCKQEAHTFDRNSTIHNHGTQSIQN